MYEVQVKVSSRIVKTYEFQKADEAKMKYGAVVLEWTEKHVYKDGVIFILLWETTTGKYIRTFRFRSLFDGTLELE